MKSVSGKEFAKILERNGWTLLRVQGSHHIYGKTDSDIRISVPVHRNQSLKIGLLKHFLKQAGLAEKRFIKIYGEQNFNAETFSDDGRRTNRALD